MRKIIFLFAALAVALIAASRPASAMEQGEAEKACAKKPNCFATYGQNGDMSIVVVTGGGKGNSEIYCPAKGPCECVMCVRMPGDSGVRGTIVGVLNGAGSTKPAGGAKPAGASKIGIVDGGLLGGGGGLGGNGPSATGSPAGGASPAAAAAQIR